MLEADRPLALFPVSRTGWTVGFYLNASIARRAYPRGPRSAWVIRQTRSKSQYRILVGHAPRIRNWARLRPLRGASRDTHNARVRIRVDERCAGAINYAARRNVEHGRLICQFASGWTGIRQRASGFWSVHPRTFLPFRAQSIKRHDHPGKNQSGTRWKRILSKNAQWWHFKAAEWFTCALLDNASLKCWGAGAPAAENGTWNNLGDQPGEMGDNLLPVNLGTGKTVVRFSSRWAHSCAILNDNSVKCWGYNADGQLGLGHTNSTPATGDNLPTVSLY